MSGPRKYAEPLLSDRVYHVFNHAVGSENLFRERENYRFFMERYALYIDPVCETFAYCQMPNHFHLLIRVRPMETLRGHASLLHRLGVPQASLADGTFVMQQFKNFFTSYAKAYNKRFTRRGALFLDYVRRIQVQDEMYFTRLVHYITTNAVHHGFCARAQDWEYSSFHAMQSERPTRLNKSLVLAHFGSLERYNALIAGPLARQEATFEFEE